MGCGPSRLRSEAYVVDDDPRFFDLPRTEDFFPYTHLLPNPVLEHLGPLDLHVAPTPPISDEARVSFLATGSAGNCYLFDFPLLNSPKRASPALSWSVSRRSVNKIKPNPFRRDDNFIEALTCAGDGAVKLWKIPMKSSFASFGLKGLGSKAPTELCTVAQHKMNCVDCEWLSADLVVSGSRDYSVRVTNVERGKMLTEPNSNFLGESQIHRNVVTALRRIDSSTFIQLSEDLEVRVWDIRDNNMLSRPSISISGGPNQLVCSSEVVAGREAFFGSKGFSRQTVEVKAFCLRTSRFRARREGAASQTIERVEVYRENNLVVASKDGTLKILKQDDLEPVSFWEKDDLDSKPFEGFEGEAPYCDVSVYKDFCLASSLGPKLTLIDLTQNKVLRSTEESPLY